MKRLVLISVLLLVSATAAGGVNVVPTVTKTVVVLTVTKTGAAAEAVLGVHFDGKAATCTAPETDASTTPIAVDMNTKKTLGSSIWTVTCIRKELTGERETVFPAFDLVLVSTAGPFTQSIPAEARVPYQFASEIQKRVDSLATATFNNVTVTYPATPGPCPAGTRDMGWIALNTYPHGPHGTGTATRVCMTKP